MSVPGNKMIDMTLEERQLSKQIHSLIKIDLENNCMSKTYWFVEPLLVLSLRQNRLEERESLG